MMNSKHNRWLALVICAGAMPVACTPTPDTINTVGGFSGAEVHAMDLNFLTEKIPCALPMP